jgi:PPM family protein phosphatase
MELNAFVDSRVGDRESNEDSHEINHGAGLFVVSDGMGGYHGGEIASRMAVDIVGDAFRGFDQDAGPLATMSQMDGAFRQANLEVRNKQTGMLARMGATLSALVFRGHDAVIGHVGDSRVYRLRGGALRRLTSDHTVVESLKAAGVTSVAIQKAFSHVLTRAVGSAEECVPDLSIEDLQVGDRYLLCTDGLTDAVDDAAIGEALEKLPASEVPAALADRAIARGNSDNVTVMVVEVRAVGSERVASADGDSAGPATRDGTEADLSKDVVDECGDVWG